VWIGRAIPRHWLAEGMKTAMRRAPTRYGPFDLVYESAITSKGTITAEVTPPKLAGLELRIRVRAPLGYTLSRVDVNGHTHTDFDRRTNTVRIPQPIARTPVTVISYWDHRK